MSLVCLQLVDVFHENLLVCEHITLHFQVQTVIHVTVNLLRFTVSFKQLSIRLSLLNLYLDSQYLSMQNSHPLHQVTFSGIGAWAVPFL